ncbi:hypothetical protein ACSNOJ_34950 [Streptomyces sp. URMC 128]|uniref:hypothetical protein n=1 Tax=Streptomyces sp. URMC 128 TaxID=3423404 RepID=UPI003F1B7C4D
MALPPVPPFAAAASTVRVPAGLTAALRRATADLRQRLAKGRRPVDPTRAAGAAAATGRTGAGDLPAITGLTSPDDVAEILGLTSGTAAAAQHPGHADRPGRTGRPWADLARSYLTFVLTLLPRPRRPAHTTITVYIATTAPLSERPTGSAPRHRGGQDRPGPGPEPDATP